MTCRNHTTDTDIMQQRAFAARARAALRAQRACAWVAGWLCSVVAAMSKDTVLVTVMHSNNEVPVPSPSPSPSLSHHLASRLGPRDRELTWSVGAACLPAATAHTHTHTHTPRTHTHTHVSMYVCMCMYVCMHA